MPLEENKYRFSENPENQDDSVLTVKESISKTQETVDEQGDKRLPKPKRKKKMIPFRAWLELHSPLDEKVSDENTEKQDASLVTVKESTYKPQETSVTGEKRPSKCNCVKKTPATWEDDNNEIITYGYWVYDLGPIGQTIFQKTFSESEPRSDLHFLLMTLKRKQKKVIMP